MSADGSTSGPTGSRSAAPDIKLNPIQDGIPMTLAPSQSSLQVAPSSVGARNWPLSATSPADGDLGSPFYNAAPHAVYGNPLHPPVEFASAAQAPAQVRAPSPSTSSGSTTTATGPVGRRRGGRKSLERGLPLPVAQPDSLAPSHARRLVRRDTTEDLLARATLGPGAAMSSVLCAEDADYVDPDTLVFSALAVGDAPPPTSAAAKAAAKARRKELVKMNTEELIETVRNESGATSQELQRLPPFVQPGPGPGPEVEPDMPPRHLVVAVTEDDYMDPATLVTAGAHLQPPPPDLTGMHSIQSKAAAKARRKELVKMNTDELIETVRNESGATSQELQRLPPFVQPGPGPGPEVEPDMPPRHLVVAVTEDDYMDPATLVTAGARLRRPPSDLLGMHSIQSTPGDGDGDDYIDPSTLITPRGPGPTPEGDYMDVATLTARADAATFLDGPDNTATLIARADAAAFLDGPDNTATLTARADAAAFLEDSEDEYIEVDSAQAVVPARVDSTDAIIRQLTAVEASTNQCLYNAMVGDSSDGSTSGSDDADDGACNAHSDDYPTDFESPGHFFRGAATHPDVPTLPPGYDSPTSIRQQLGLTQHTSAGIRTSGQPRPPRPTAGPPRAGVGDASMGQHPYDTPSGVLRPKSSTLNQAPPLPPRHTIDLTDHFAALPSPAPHHHHRVEWTPSADAEIYDGMGFAPSALAPAVPPRNAGIPRVEAEVASLPGHSGKANHHGWLSKAPEHIGISRDRWFELSDEYPGQLRYFAKPGGEPRGVIDLKIVTAVRRSGLTLELRAPDRTFKLAALDPHAAAHWKIAIQTHFDPPGPSLRGPAAAAASPARPGRSWSGDNTALNRFMRDDDGHNGSVVTARVGGRVGGTIDPTANHFDDEAADRVSDYDVLASASWWLHPRLSRAEAEAKLTMQGLENGKGGGSLSCLLNRVLPF